MQYQKRQSDHTFAISSSRRWDRLRTAAELQSERRSECAGDDGSSSHRRAVIAVVNIVV